MRVTIWPVLLLCGLAVPADAQQQAPTPVTVGVVKAERTAITQDADIRRARRGDQSRRGRARVTGYLEEVLFKEGDLVKEGAPLYRIEQGLFQAAVEQAQGALERSKAAQVADRRSSCSARRICSTSRPAPSWRATRRWPPTTRRRAPSWRTRPTSHTAKINLGYTDIASPIDGEVGRTNITKGNVVGPDSGVLTVIVSQDPMYVTFPVSQREFLRAREAGREVGTRTSRTIKVRIRFSDGSAYDQIGTLNFVDVTVDRATDTVLVRATVPNPKSALIDGQLVTVELEVGTPRGEGRGAAGRPDRRSGRRLCLRGRGRQGGDQARQDRRRGRAPAS